MWHTGRELARHTYLQAFPLGRVPPAYVPPPPRPRLSLQRATPAPVPSLPASADQQASGRV